MTIVSGQTSSLRYTLLTDGTSDVALLPILRWILLNAGITCPLVEQWANPRFSDAPSGGLSDRIKDALNRYPCDLIFIHRDAERQDPNLRRTEISAALSEHGTTPPAVHVIPVRMTEAWLLTDEAAIRRAADNPNGTNAISMPTLRSIEDLPDPKQTLNELLRSACNLHGRRLDRFKRDESHRRRRVADLTSDFSSLQNLAAFRQLQSDIESLLTQQGWLL